MMNPQARRYRIEATKLARAAEQAAIIVAPKDPL
jgi:hypothetical protein